MSREYALAIWHLVECLDKFRTIDFSDDATRDPSLLPDRSAVSIGGYVHEAIQDVARQCPTGQLPQELRTNWDQLCQSKDNDDDGQWEGMAHIESQNLRTWAYSLYRGACRMRLTSAGEPVLVPDGSDPDGPEARRMENLSFAEFLRRVSDPEVEYDHALVDAVIDWVDQGERETTTYAQLSAAVLVERTYRKRATELLPGYSGPDDTHKIAALVCKHCNLQPSEFHRMNVRDRTPFVEIAIIESWKTPIDSERENIAKLFPHGIPNDSDIVDLVVRLDSAKGTDATQLETARAFTKEAKGSDPKAKKLLARIRMLKTRGKLNL